MVANQSPDDDVETILEPYRDSLSYELKQAVSYETAARALVDRSRDLDALKVALKRPYERIEISERTNNLVIRDGDGSNVAVLSPRDASQLASELSHYAHLAAEIEEGSDDE